MSGRGSAWLECPPKAEGRQFRLRTFKKNLKKIEKCRGVAQLG